MLLDGCRCFKSDLTVHKTIKPWSLFSQAWNINFPELREMYSRTIQAAGLVHAVGSPTLNDTEDTYSIYLAPLGLQRGDAEPDNERSAANAVHGLLHGLAALHKVWNTYL